MLSPFRAAIGSRLSGACICRINKLLIVPDIIAGGCGWWEKHISQNVLIISSKRRPQAGVFCFVCGWRTVTQKEFYKSTTWKRTRRAFIAERISIDGGLCTNCQQELGKIVHHKIHLNDNNVDNLDISVSFDNLTYLCQMCHNKLHMTKPKRYYFDAKGNIINGGLDY